MKTAAINRYPMRAASFPGMCSRRELLEGKYSPSSSVSLGNSFRCANVMLILTEPHVFRGFVHIMYMHTSKNLKVSASAAGPLSSVFGHFASRRLGG